MARKGGRSGGRNNRVRGHTRSPRGPNKGKKPVRVRAYRRRKARG